MTLQDNGKSVRNTVCKAPIFYCHSELNQSRHSALFYFPLNCVLWCRWIFFSPSMTIMSQTNGHLSLRPWVSDCATAFQYSSWAIKEWAESIFVTTAVSSNFYSTNSRQSPFNGISINLLNGFKNSLALMWISEILMWTLKVCSRCTQFDRISSVWVRLSPCS